MPSTLDTIYRCPFNVWHIPCAWVGWQQDNWKSKRCSLICFDAFSLNSLFSSDSLRVEVRQNILVHWSIKIKMLYSTPSNPCQCIFWCEACMQLPAIETHFVKLPTHRYCAVINVRGGLNLFSCGISRVLVVFTHHAPQHSMTCSVTLIWSSTSWLSCCCS